jgi:virulence factor Mce-like protein
VLERKTSIRTLGALFLAMVVFFVWLTYAFFDKQFVDYDPITVKASKAGVNLPENADVKLRGVIVGEVRSIEPTEDGVEMLLAMKPDLLADVPAGVSAQIVPKTLFGEKFISLIPPATSTGESLQAGDVIERATVPIEVEELLNDLQPLLTAVDPANLSYTLTAVSDALDGRGKELGETLVTANRYLQKTNPDVPQLVDDLIKLGTVADGYADAMPELGRLLRNATFTGNTVVAKRAQLAAFFDEGTQLADTLTDFTKANGDNLVQLAGDSRPVLDVLGDYAPTFPCFLAGMSELIPRLDSAFRGGQLHIDARLITQPDAYDDDENLDISQQQFDDASQGPSARPRNGKSASEDIRSNNAATPSCLDLNQIVGDPDQKYSSQDGQVFTVPPEVYQLVNINNDHNGKFGEPGDFERVAPASNGLLSAVQPSIGGIDTSEQRAALNVLFGARAGVDPGDVPDVAALMMGPALHGTAVTLR